jgi:divalent metal cation (Fe/Co/Zn/Cd) transporter
VRRFIGATFIALALYVLLQAGWILWSQETVDESLLGIILAGVSLVVMLLVAWGTLRAATVIHSAAPRAEAQETRACSYLSFTLLLGLVANAAAGWWWADPVAKWKKRCYHASEKPCGNSERGAARFLLQEVVCTQTPIRG